MALNKLTLPPDQDGYGFEDGEEALMAPGAAPGLRGCAPGGWMTLDAQWTLDREGYAALRAFYDANKSLYFLCDLIIEDDAPTEHRCFFAPKSFRLAAQYGLTYVQRAQLYVKPTA